MRIDPLLSGPAYFRGGRVLLLLLVLALLRSEASLGGDVSAQVELLGNPYLPRYTANPNQRSVNRMRTLNNRVYLGNGSTASGAPTDIWYFDVAQDRFVKEAVIFEETIEQMRVFGDCLMLPGRDSMGLGAFYRWDSANGWMTQKVGVGTDGHYMDIYEKFGRIFVHCSILANANYPYPRIAISANDGQSFTVPGQLIDGVNFNSFNGSHWQFFEYRGTLYSTILRSSAPDPNYPPTPSHPPYMVKYTGNDLAPIARVHQHYVDFCPPAETWVISDFVEFTPNLAVFNGGGNLFRVTDVEAPTPTTRIDLPFTPPADGSIGMGLAGILKAAGALYTCSNISSNGQWQIAVCKSIDGLTWNQEFHFNSANRVRSFERTVNGDFLFAVRAPSSPEMGNILRVRSEAVAGGALPLVNLSADETTVWEGSGNGLTLRVRRAGNLGSALVVNYSVGGTAVAGTDFVALSGTVTIPASAHSVNVPITVIQSPANTGARTLSVTLQANAGYTIAAPSQITFTITDATAGNTPMPANGLALWMRADAGVTISGANLVDSWADQSGRGYVGTQTINVRKPKLTAAGPNGLPAIVFDGGDCLNVGSINSQIYFAAVVLSNRLTITKTTVETLLNFMAHAEGGSSGIDLGSAQTQFTDEVIGFYQQAWRELGDINNVVPAGPHRLIFSQSAHAAPFTMSIDSVNKTVTSQNANRNITPTGDTFRIGSRTGENRFFDGSISEIVIYNRPLSAAEVTAVDNYLAQKYFAANVAPVASDDTVSRVAGGGISIPIPALLANDTDANGDTLSVTAVANAAPAGASVNITGNMVVYTPAPGPDVDGSFTYTVSDGEGGTDEGTVTVIVNRPPVAAPDAFVRNAGSDLVVAKSALLANDSDPDGDSFSFVSAARAPGSPATVTIEGANIRFRAPAGNNQNDTFNYTIQDSRGLAATGVVTVNVANRPPVATRDVRSTTMNVSLALTHANLIANDSDPDGDGIAITGSDAVSAQGGAVLYQAAQITYTPPAGFVGSDSFGYTLTDSRGASSVGRVLLQVNAPNQPPTPQADAVNRQADQSVTISFATLLANDTDPDGHALTVAAVTGTSALGATITLNAGSVTYNAIVGVNGPDSFSYTVVDTLGAMGTAAVTVTATGAFRAAAAPPPPRVAGGLASVTLRADGKLAFRAHAEPGTVLRVETSTALAEGWRRFRDIRASDQGNCYFEEEAEGEARFFRVSQVEQ